VPPVQLTILGSNGTYSTPGRPASGYLIRQDGTKIWMDAGPGTFAALQAVTDFVSLDAVILSHVHADHCTDLIGFYHAVRYGARRREGIPIYCPQGLPDRLLHFMGAGDGDTASTCEFLVVGDGDEIKVGGIEIRFATTQHSVPTLASRLESDGRVLAYSADTGPEGDWPGLAKEADLLLIEATYQGASEDKPWAHHLTAGEAGEIARRVGARKAFLTHIWPTLDPRQSVEEASATFGRPADLAVPGTEMTV
jgi:ribonuclease BN (tRNA processing enzyme)